MSAGLSSRLRFQYRFSKQSLPDSLNLKYVPSQITSDIRQGRNNILKIERQHPILAF